MDRQRRGSVREARSPRPEYWHLWAHLMHQGFPRAASHQRSPLVFSLGISFIPSRPSIEPQKRRRGAIPAAARSHRTPAPYLAANLISVMSLEDLSFTRNGLLLEGLSGLRHSNSSVVLDAESSRVMISIDELEIPSVKLASRILSVFRAVCGRNQRLCPSSKKRLVPNHSKLANCWMMY